MRGPSREVSLPSTWWRTWKHPRGEKMLRREPAALPLGCQTTEAIGPERLEFSQGPQVGKGETLNLVPDRGGASVPGRDFTQFWQLQAGQAASQSVMTGGTMTWPGTAQLRTPPTSCLLCKPEPHVRTPQMDFGVTESLCSSSQHGQNEKKNLPFPLLLVSLIGLMRVGSWAWVVTAFRAKVLTQQACMGLWDTCGALCTMCTLTWGLRSQTQTGRPNVSFLPLAPFYPFFSY